MVGGFAGVWLGENATATRQAGQVQQLQLMAKKLGIYAQASREVAQDGISFESQLTDALINSIRFNLDDAFISGNGVGKPLGILNDPALITVDKEGGQASATINFLNATKMLQRLYPACVRNAIWIVNQTCTTQLMTTYVAAGTISATVIPLLVRTGNGYEMLGRPVIFSEKGPALGTVGDIILADITQYAIGLRQDVVFDRSNALGWTEDAIDYRVILRVDGQGTWTSAITPKNGDSLSWCVALQTRD